MPTKLAEMSKVRRLLIVGLFVTQAVVQAQHEHSQNQVNHDQHVGHDMHGSADSSTADDGQPVWRMPPMDTSMPMLPGLERAMPITAPFLPGVGVDPQSFPEAVPAEIIEMEDGESLNLEATLVRRTINGKSFVMYGYNGQYPGPLIKAEKGSTVIVHFKNDIEMPTTVHWHGLRLDNRFDGVPNVTQPPVAPGETFTYELFFRDAGIYWYHPHMREDIQQDLGLYGNMLVAPLRTDYYAPVNREEIVILDDILMDNAGLIPWGETVPTHALMGRFGNVMLINGTTDYRVSVDRGEIVRFYITNVANSRTFNLVFGGARMKVVGSDVSKFEHEEWVESVVIAPAERYIIEARFETPGEALITNSIQAIDEFRGEFYPRVDTLGTVVVSDNAVADDFGHGFETLRTHEDVRQDVETYRVHFDRPVDHRLELTLRVNDLPLPIIRAMEFEAGLYSPPIEWNDAMPMMNWLSSADQIEWILRDPDTGKENMEINWAFRKGDVVKLRIFNNPNTLHPMNHPFHMHGQRYLVLSIDGVSNKNLVWKDTSVIPVGSTVDILADISNPGTWMMHCHIAEHLHAGMMLSFVVSGDTHE